MALKLSQDAIDRAVVIAFNYAVDCITDEDATPKTRLEAARFILTKFDDKPSDQPSVLKFIVQDFKEQP